MKIIHANERQATHIYNDHVIFCSSKSLNSARAHTHFISIRIRPTRSFGPTTDDTINAVVISHSFVAVQTHAYHETTEARTEPVFDSFRIRATSEWPSDSSTSYSVHVPVFHTKYARLYFSICSFHCAVCTFLFHAIFINELVRLVPGC